MINANTVEEIEESKREMNETISNAIMEFASKHSIKRLKIQIEPVAHFGGTIEGVIISSDVIL